MRKKKAVQAQQNDASPFLDVAEELLIELNSGSDDLSWYMTEQGKQVGVNDSGASAASISQHHPQLGKDGLPHVHMGPTIL